MLTKDQSLLAEKLFPRLKDYSLVGGTALALQIGHRRSLDFGLASRRQPIELFQLERRLMSKAFQIQRTFTATADGYSALVQDVKPLSFRFPLDVQHLISRERSNITLPPSGTWEP